MNCPRRHICWQSKRFYWERAPRWRAGGWGNPGELLCSVAHSLGFYGDGISFQVVFNESFWLRVLPGGAGLVQPNGCQREGFWEVVRHVVSPFDLSWTLLVGGGLLVLCSLPGPPVIKQLMKWSLWCLARVGSFSQCASPKQIHRLYSLWNSPGQDTGMGSLSFLQGIFPTQGLNLGLAHCRWISTSWAMETEKAHNPPSTS